MCGIFGIISLEKSKKKEATKIEDQLKNRGPDNTGFLKINKSIIGNTRLAVVDQDPKSNQPFFSKSRKTIIVFNGEIYNYQELKKKYKLETSTNSDTEVLVELYELIGENIFEEIDGMYAICIYSYINKKFTLARDSLGIKPLFYFKKENSIFFSSEIKGILNTNSYEENINLNSVIDFISLGLIDHSKNTFFKDVYSLQAGEIIEINQTLELNSKIRLNYIDIAKNNLHKNKGFLEELFEEELIKSIKMQSKTVRSLGSHLSGGIDSCLITTLLAKEKQNINTYTFGYEEENFDERPKAKKIAANLNLKNNDSLLKFEDIDHLFLKTLKIHDEPFTSLRQLSHLKIYLDFKSESTVIFESSGGDEIGAGYKGFIWPNFIDESLVHGFEVAFEKFKLYAQARKIYNIEKFISHNSINLNQYGLCTSDGTYASATKYIKDKNKVIERIDLSNKNLNLPFDSYLRNSQFLELSKSKLPRGLRYIDRSSSAVGKEARVPLLTNSIVGLGLALPPESKLNQNSSRVLMREITKKNCPFLKDNKLKKDIADPQGIWMKTKLAPTILKVFSSKRFKGRSIFNHEVLIEDFKKYIKGDNSFHSLQFFNIFILEIWIRFFIETSIEERDKFDSLNYFINETQA